jgi:hypothetical protein
MRLRARLICCRALRRAVQGRPQASYLTGQLAFCEHVDADHPVRYAIALPHGLCRGLARGFDVDLKAGHPHRRADEGNASVVPLSKQTTKLVREAQGIALCCRAQCP